MKYPGIPFLPPYRRYSIQNSLYPPYQSKESKIPTPKWRLPGNKAS